MMRIPVWSKLAVIVVAVAAFSVSAQRNSRQVHTTAPGVEGIIENGAVSTARGAVNAAHAFEAAEIVGGFGDRSVAIIDESTVDFDPLTLTRSFREALKENVDRETVDRLSR
ncbi:MAG: hypothetical protein LBC70_00475 [Chitinispirillales bacterium]|jgi:hypothetical protein|nr:hypothetical protein [Chitinispirillales bacterium]